MILARVTSRWKWKWLVRRFIPSRDRWSEYVLIPAPPLPPTGPLEISNVSKDHATLSWKPPKDDGGNRVTGYIVERRDTSKGADAWIPVVQGCRETTFTVPSLLDGHEYEFRVMALNENGVSEPLRSSAPVTAKLPFSMFNEEKKRTDLRFLSHP